jgi:hypothetical protein
LLLENVFFLLLAPGSSPEKFAVIVNLGNKPTTKLFFNKGLIRDLILLGKADKQIFSPEKNG